MIEIRDFHTGKVIKITYLKNEIVPPFNMLLTSIMLRKILIRKEDGRIFTEVYKNGKKQD